MTSEIFNCIQNESSSLDNNSIKDNDTNKNNENQVKKVNMKTLYNIRDQSSNSNNSENNEENEVLKKLNIDNNNYSNLYIPSLFTNNYDEIREYICPICSNLFDEPTMELCGCHKIYCKNCLLDYLSKNDNKCPFSKKVIKIEPQFVPVIFHTINFFEIKCRNYKYGCVWKGKCGKYKEHLIKYCLKEYIKCLNNGCDEFIMKENMNNHLKECKYRYILCKLCRSKVQYIDKKKHEEICNNKNDKNDSGCPYECGEENIDKTNNKKNNNINLIDCPFITFGCKEKLFEGDMEKHKSSNINEHLLLFGERIKKNEEELKNLYKLFENFNNNLNYFSSNQSMIIENESKKSNSNLSLKKDLLKSKNSDKNSYSINSAKELKTQEIVSSSNLNSCESKELKNFNNTENME